MPVKQQIGIVVSTKMQKTIVVKIENKYLHPIYSKTMLKTKKEMLRWDIKNLLRWDIYNDNFGPKSLNVCILVA